MTDKDSQRHHIESFGQYAFWYDVFNDEKDYVAESKYVLNNARRWKPVLKTWLDIGCGTGKHLAYLRSKKISVAGVDNSSQMISLAKEAYPKIPFFVSSADEFQLSRDWDVISMLFHVMSYFVDDAEIGGALKNISAHLGPKGVLIFDFWHTSGLINDPPQVRTRKKVIDGRTLFRTAYPTEDRKMDRVDILYKFRWDSENAPVIHQESHVMRHFTVEGLKSFLNNAGLQILKCDGWMKDRAINKNDWYGLILAQKTDIDT